MRKEIGSEFWSIPLSDNTNAIFNENVNWFISGRSALEAIILQIKNKIGADIVYLPSWCCDSMIIPFLKHGINVKFYPVYLHKNELVQDIPQTKRNELLLLIDYFGYTSGVNCSDRNAIVIRDLTHSIFSKTYSDADYYFGSLRKWCGFKTGGFAIGLNAEQLPSDDAYIALRTTAMEAKAKYILGENDGKGFLKTFAEAEEYLEQSSIAGADSREIGLSDKIDVDFIKAKRRENATVLMEAFPNLLVFKTLQKKDCPLFVPIVIPERERDELRRYLIAKEIYLPIHWPISSYHNLDNKTKDIYNREISLVCDQRYGKEDMYRMIEAINDFFKR